MAAIILEDVLKKLKENGNEDLISRAYLFNAMSTLDFPEKAAVFNIIQNAQAPKENYWINDPIFGGGYDLPNQVGLASCSACGISVDNCGVLNGYNYCPCCGSEMKGVKDAP